MDFRPVRAIMPPDHADRPSCPPDLPGQARSPGRQARRLGGARPHNWRRRCGPSPQRDSGHPHQRQPASRAPLDLIRKTLLARRHDRRPPDLCPSPRTDRSAHPQTPVRRPAGGGNRRLRWHGPNRRHRPACLVFLWAPDRPGLAIADAPTVTAADALDAKSCFTASPRLSQRHRVRDNLPGSGHDCWCGRPHGISCQTWCC
jgi:hypothetical protein